MLSYIQSEKMIGLPSENAIKPYLNHYIVFGRALLNTVQEIQIYLPSKNNGDAAQKHALLIKIV